MTRMIFGKAVAATLAVAGTLAMSGVAFAGAAGGEQATEGPAAAPVTSTTVETRTEKPFTPSIAVGPMIGYAHQSEEGGDFGWGVDALARVVKYGSLQLEYWSLGNAHNPGGSGNGGHFDGLYVGLMPVFPIGETGLEPYVQVGGAFCDEGNDVAAGAGLMYVLPIEWFAKNHMDLLLRLDYKYFNIEDQGERGQHLLTTGFMIAFHKSK